MKKGRVFPRSVTFYGRGGRKFLVFFGGRGGRGKGKKKKKKWADKMNVCWNERPASLFISSAKGSQFLRPSDGREERNAAHFRRWCDLLGLQIESALLTWRSFPNNAAFCLYQIKWSKVSRMIIIEMKLIERFIWYSVR